MGLLFTMTSPSGAVIRFELPDVSIHASGPGPVSGFFDVTIRADLDDLPRAIGSLNVEVLAGSSLVSFQPAILPPDPLLTGTVLDFSPNNQNSRSAIDLYPNAAALADNLGLVRIPFTVNSGPAASFTLSFGPLNQLADSNAAVLPIFTSDVGSITVISATAASADFDSDGDVDGADFLAWQRGQGLVGGATLSQGDADGDQAVNGADLTVWRGQFGAAALAASAPSSLTPEPGSGALLLIGLTSAALRRSVRRRLVRLAS